VPRYDYRCAKGHVTEARFPMAEVPPDITCGFCSDTAKRVFQAPAAIHFRGPGFYSTDVKGRIGRKRRSNPGDDLHTEFDAPAARIADAI
jgi:putative FmdB family regulatory protein